MEIIDKKYHKYFSCNKYGHDKAFNLACEQRARWEKELGVYEQINSK